MRRAPLGVGLLSAALVNGSVVTTAVAAPSGSRERREQPPTRPACSTALEERNRAIFQEYLDDRFSGDVAGADAAFTEDAVVDEHGSVPYQGTYAAGEEYGATITRYWTITATGGTVEPILHADCDQVIMRIQFQAAAVKTGTPVDTTVIEYFTFTEDGKIARDDFYFTDTAEVNRALGA